jgi:hypothetical protein
MIKKVFLTLGVAAFLLAGSFAFTSGPLVGSAKANNQQWQNQNQNQWQWQKNRCCKHQDHKEMHCKKQHDRDKCHCQYRIIWKNWDENNWQNNYWRWSNNHWVWMR